MFSNTHLPEDTKHPNTELSDTHFRLIAEFLSLNCGIVLSANKQYLVRNRLLSLLGKLDLNSFADLAVALQSSSPANSKLKAAVIDAMTTNETYWFREEKQFQVLKEQIFPEMFTQKNGTIKIWSAACSSGQEPYSISISALEAAQCTGRHKPVQIIGTDISETVINEAKNAVYSEITLSRGITPAIQARYFQKDFAGHRLNTEASQQVRFQQFNLLKPFTALGRFDIIFCRNVLIYFSEQVKRDILFRMADSLEPGGYLFLSSTEAMPEDISAFQAIYAKGTSYFKKV